MSDMTPKEAAERLTKLAQEKQALKFKAPNIKPPKIDVGRTGKLFKELALPGAALPIAYEGLPGVMGGLRENVFAGEHGWKPGLAALGVASLASPRQWINLSKKLPKAFNEGEDIINTAIKGSLGPFALKGGALGLPLGVHALENVLDVTEGAKTMADTGAEQAGHVDAMRQQAQQVMDESMSTMDQISNLPTALGEQLSNVAKDTTGDLTKSIDAVRGDARKALLGAGIGLGGAGLGYGAYKLISKLMEERTKQKRIEAKKDAPPRRRKITIDPGDYQLALDLHKEQGGDPETLKSQQQLPPELLGQLAALGGR